MFQVVTAKGHRYPAVVVGASKTSRDHNITVPFGTPFTLQVISPRLTVNDAAGAPADAAARNIPVASTAAALTYTVTGAKQ